MLVHTQMKHDIVCWTIAIGLHLLLLLANFNLHRTGEAKRLIPIVEIEYVTHEDILRARRIRTPGRPPETFKEKMKHFFSKRVAPPKKEKLLAGKGPSKLEVDKIKGISQEKTLVDKKGALSKKVDLSLKDKSREKLFHKEESILVASKESNLKELKLENLRDKEYKVAKKDLPFQVNNSERIIDNGMDRVAINLGKETSKDILTQAPTLEDIKGKAGFDEGVFRVVKQEAEGKLSGSEVLADLLAMAKQGQASGGGGSGTGSGVGTGGSGESSVGTGAAATGTSSKEGGSQEKAFRKGVVFSRVPKREGGLAGSGSEESSSGSGAQREVAKKGQRGRVIFEITGPLSKRTILHKVLPSYPEWAEKEGIEAGVRIHFVVLSNGKVKDNIYVVRTSGYPFMDKLVMEALRDWLFASLKGDIYGKEEWGVLTFYFSLEGGG